MRIRFCMNADHLIFKRCEMMLRNLNLQKLVEKLSILGTPQQEDGLAMDPGQPAKMTKVEIEKS